MLMWRDLRGRGVWGLRLRGRISRGLLLGSIRDLLWRVWVHGVVEVEVESLEDDGSCAGWWVDLII